MSTEQLYRSFNTLFFRQAEQIMKLKDATMSSYQYFIKQLTHSGKYDDDFNNSWDSFLIILGNLLDEHAIKS